jgi:2-succinyl-6-hydroxy-2,4-cyclohexadiene-1-carboxylate synthase
MRVGYLHGFLGDAAAARDADLGFPGEDDGGFWIPLPGHGSRDARAEDRGGPVLATWAENIAAVAARIGTCNAIVGYSLGARVATALVVGGFVPRAVLISVNPGIDDADRPARRASDAVWANMLREQGIAAFLAAWEAQPLFASQARVAAELRDARRARRELLHPEQLARSLETMGLAEMPDYRGAIDHRFALIAGADDPKYVAIARALPAPLEVIANAGHDPTFEQPEAASAAISRALERLQGK